MALGNPVFEKLGRLVVTLCGDRAVVLLLETVMGKSVLSMMVGVKFVSRFDSIHSFGVPGKEIILRTISYTQHLSMPLLFYILFLFGE